MERLTERFSNGQGAAKYCGKDCKYLHAYCDHMDECPHIDEIIEKLAYYEDMEERGEITPSKEFNHKGIKKYHVNVHYEGGYSFDVEASTENEAREIAMSMFEELSNDDLCRNLADCFVDDSWEI